MDLVEVMKLGGDAIRERAAAVEDGLIVDEEALAASLDYKFAVDDLEDSLKAMSQTASPVTRNPPRQRRRIVPMRTSLMSPAMHTTSDAMAAATRDIPILNKIVSPANNPGA